MTIFQDHWGSSPHMDERFSDRSKFGFLVNGNGISMQWTRLTKTHHFKYNSIFADESLRGRERGRSDEICRSCWGALALLSTLTRFHFNMRHKTQSFHSENKLSVDGWKRRGHSHSLPDSCLISHDISFPDSHVRRFKTMTYLVWMLGFIVAWLANWSKLSVLATRI